MIELTADSTTRSISFQSQIRKCFPPFLSLMMMYTAPHTASANCHVFIFLQEARTSFLSIYRNLSLHLLSSSSSSIKTQICPFDSVVIQLNFLAFFAVNFGVLLMEIIPAVNRITSFADKLHHHHHLNMNNNPSSSSFISRVFHFMDTQEISTQIYNLWAWGALILAVIATFTGGINRAKIIIFRLWKGNSVISNPLLQTYEDDDDDSSSSSSSVSSSDEEDEDEDEDEEEEEEEENQDDQDFRVAGFCNYNEDKGQMRKKKLYRRRSSKNRFSWADFTNGKSVVKLWEGLGLGLGFESCSESVISMLDLNRNQITNSFLGGGSSCQIPAVTAISPAVIMSGEFENDNRKKAALRVWDSRTGRRTPEAIAEWIPHRRSNKMGIDSDGLGMVYVNDDVSSTIRDLRKLGSPFEIVTEFDVTNNTFWEW